MVAERVPVGAIDRFIAEQMELGRTPGLALTVVRHGETVLQRGYGYADVATRAPMTADAAVVIGSTTKALTCTAIMQLVDRGAVALDAPIRDYLPRFRVADEAASARMTVRQAMTHTAGLLPSAADNPFFLFSDDAADDALERYVDSLATTRVLAQPGERWVYANDGFVIAGRIVEVVSGLSYEEYMRRNIVEPLGLTDSSFEPAVQAGLEMATAHDYDRDGQPYPSFRARNRASAAAGSQLAMSARDAGRWLAAMLDGGRVNGTRLLSERSYAELVRPQARVAPSSGRGLDGADLWYALGWMVARPHGELTLSHGGATITMGSQFILLPQRRLGVAVVANSVTDVTAIVAEGVTNLLCDRTPARSFPRFDPLFQPDRTLWPRLTGTYRALVAQNKVTGPWTIVLDGERLRVRTYPGDSRRRPGDIFLLPLADTRFVLFGRGRTGGVASFEVNGDSVRGVWEDVPIAKES